MREWREVPGGVAGLVGLIFLGTFILTDWSLASAAAMVALYLVAAAAVFTVAFAALVFIERRALWERRLREGQDADPHEVPYGDLALAAVSIGAQLPIGAASLAFLLFAVASVFVGGFASWPYCGPGVPGRLC